MGTKKRNEKKEKNNGALLASRDLWLFSKTDFQID